MMQPDINYHGPVVAFDLDDTLFRERDFCRSGFRFLCDPVRYRVADLDPYPSGEALSLLAGRMDRELTGRKNPFVPFEEFFRPLAEAAGKGWNLQEHIGAYRSHQPEGLPLAEGVAEVLESLAAAGVRMAIVTDGRSVTQRRKIEALGLFRFVSPECIFISEETGADKHSPDMFAAVVRRFPEASGFFYVGDNLAKDFYHPNLLGWTTLRVPEHPDNVHPPVAAPDPAYEPSALLPSFSALREYIL
ncbi:MAG: HAD-IA family hydrolase [Muribaculaceae bacterium]|nr:HAD-IA family hydrolase [Muribaculaceae bacterium]